MPKVSIYLPDDLYREARARGVPLSSVAQQAIESTLERARTREWVSQVRGRGPRCRARIDTGAVLDDVRDEFGR